MTKKESGEEPGILLIQDEGKKEQTDPHLILVLKRLREKLDEWLKSINDRIESEDFEKYLGMGKREGRYKDRIF
jgi:hypothetical protein